MYIIYDPHQPCSVFFFGYGPIKNQSKMSKIFWHSKTPGGWVVKVQKKKRFWDEKEKTKSCGFMCKHTYTHMRARSYNRFLKKRNKKKERLNKTGKMAWESNAFCGWKNEWRGRLCLFLISFFGKDRVWTAPLSYCFDVGVSVSRHLGRNVIHDRGERREKKRKAFGSPVFFSFFFHR